MTAFRRKTEVITCSVLLPDESNTVTTPLLTIRGIKLNVIPIGQLIFGILKKLYLKGEFTQAVNFWIRSDITSLVLLSKYVCI